MVLPHQLYHPQGTGMRPLSTADLLHEPGYIESPPTSPGAPPAPPPSPPTLTQQSSKPLLDEHEYSAYAEFLQQIGNDQNFIFNPSLPEKLAPWPSEYGELRGIPHRIRLPPIDTSSLFQSHTPPPPLHWGSDPNFDVQKGYTTRRMDHRLSYPPIQQLSREASASPSIEPEDQNTGKRKGRKRAQSYRRDNLTDQQKRANHIQSEQKRRNLIKDGFQELHTLVPTIFDVGVSKSTVLFETGKFIQLLHDDNARLKRVLGKE